MTKTIGTHGQAQPLSFGIRLLDEHFFWFSVRIVDLDLATLALADGHARLTPAPVALPAQSVGGTDGPEASGVLFDAVEAFLRLGRGLEARRVAAQIALPSLHERAARLCK